MVGFSRRLNCFKCLAIALLWSHQSVLKNSGHHILYFVVNVSVKFLALMVVVIESKVLNSKRQIQKWGIFQETTYCLL